MDNDIYTDPVLKKYADLIRAGMPALKEIFFGDPLQIPVSGLPALTLAKVDTRVRNFSNKEDLHEMRLSFTLVTDIRSTISEDKTMVAGVNALYNLMEGRQAGTYQLKPDSLLYIIRHNVEVDVANNLRTDLDTISRISYGMTMGKRAPDAWSIEGTLELTANFTQIR